MSIVTVILIEWDNNKTKCNSNNNNYNTNSSSTSSSTSADSNSNTTYNPDSAIRKTSILLLYFYLV